MMAEEILIENDVIFSKLKNIDDQFIEIFKN